MCEVGTPWHTPTKSIVLASKPAQQTLTNVLYHKGAIFDVFRCQQPESLQAHLGHPVTVLLATCRAHQRLSKPLTLPSKVCLPGLWDYLILDHTVLAFLPARACLLCTLYTQEAVQTLRLL